MSELVDKEHRRRHTLPQNAPSFKGFPEFRSNVLYCPKQFFTVVVPASSVNCIRLIAHMLRKTLGWVDESGEPIKEQHEFTYRELEQNAGIVHSGLQKAIGEALACGFINCVQQARVQTQGVKAQSAAYELLWDDLRYTDEPAKFKGFFIQPTYIDDSGQTRLGRKNIPNIFFDYLVRNENRGVIRTVGALLWYSIDWGKGGERRQPVKKSLRDLVELTRLDKSSVVRALDEAVERGYIERLERGVFDLTGQKQSSITVYGIHWTSEYTYTYEGLAVEVPGERSKNATRDLPANAPNMQHGPDAPTLQKHNTANTLEHSKYATRNAPKTPREERSKNATKVITNIEITNTSIETTTQDSPSPGTSVVAADKIRAGIHILTQKGFSNKVAEILASNNPLDVIEAQIHYLPKRRATKNTLGLLRRSIEENWPLPPEVKLPTSVVPSGPGADFAAYFYAGYHGNPSAPVSVPSEADAAAADNLVSRLLHEIPDISQVAGWGRQFGEMISYHHRKSERAFPALRPAIQQFGDEFFSYLRNVREAQKKQKLQERYTAHRDKYQAAHEAYVRQELDRHKREETDTYVAFEKQRSDQRKRLATNQFSPDVGSVFKHFDDDETRLVQFKAFLSSTREPDYLDFWEWDSQMNSEPFDERAVLL